jgi:DedD protein
MRQVFEDEEMEEPVRDNETELTLGSTGVLILFVALLAVCGACFGVGYAMGHRGDENAAAAPRTAASPDAPTAGAAKQKPSAAPPAAASLPADASAAAPPTADPDGGIVTGSTPAQAAGSSPLAAAGQPGAGGSQWAVKPALAGQGAPNPPGTATAYAAPAAPAQNIMVQIAAVSHAEDANVLMNALLRRGYAVTARRDLADNLIHVRVGPFSNWNDANAMRLKLLSDGYNAMVEP